MRAGVTAVLGIAGAALLGTLAGCTSGPARTGSQSDARTEPPKGGSGPVVDAGQEPPPHPDAGIGRTPERTWLDAIGQGPAQTARVCARGYEDNVARALCAPGVTIGSLDDLYRVLGPPAVTPDFSLALAASSSGLSHRAVSALNPRVFRTTVPDVATKQEPFLITAFTRGEQQVEVVGYDERQRRLGFYLVTFDQRCTEGGCTPHQLLGPEVETGWTGWTMYAADDLQDTALDCTSCHQPAGPGTPMRLLMRDAPEPWFHWFLPVDEMSNCPNGSPPRKRLPDLFATFQAGQASLDGPDGVGRYGALDRTALRHATGHNLQTAITVFAFERMRGTTFEDPYVMDSRAVVDEWRCDVRNELWARYRADVLLQRGLPVPEVQFDRLDPVRAVGARGDYAGFLRQHPDDDAFELAASLVSDDVQRAIGVRPDPSLDAAGMMREMCVRCHDDRAPAGSRRGRFRVDAVTSAGAQEAIRRIGLPSTSPYVMPPRRAGRLDSDEIGKLRSHLEALTAR